jgi:hypothetical protein
MPPRCWRSSNVEHAQPAQPKGGRGPGKLSPKGPTDGAEYVIHKPRGSGVPPRRRGTPFWEQARRLSHR